LEKAKRASRSDSPVLVVGETVTGKELVVQSIHHHFSRSAHPLIAQNCAAIPASLLEGILFGTAKGAFTGAEDRPGLFELADGGTLFLDEIQAMPIDIQAKLLRSLEEGVIRRVGGMATYPVNVRIIVAINEDPLESMEKGHLRRDLFYRIHVVGIHLPPLRERREDIRLLVTHFLQMLQGEEHLSVSRDVMDTFLQYSWPGNVRELKHTLEGAVNITPGKVIRREDLPPYIRNCDEAEFEEFFHLKKQLSRVEEQIIQKAMSDTGGNIKKAALLLGIPRQTLQYKLKKRKIERGSIS
jgi:arginine utilization regulatory protein